MKILALDLGSHSIKAVELDVSFGRVELADYFIEPVTEPTPPAQASKSDEVKDETEAPKEKKPKKQRRKVLTDGQIDALKRLITDKNLTSQQNRYDKVVVNLPRGWVTTRLFHFPTKDRKAIQNSLNFELEDEVPIAIDDLIIDFGILKSEGNNSTVFAAMAVKADVTQLLSELNLLGLDPDSVTIDSWAQSQMLKRAIPVELAAKPVLMLNIGAKSTEMNIFVQSEPVLTHTATTGGDAITNAISASYGLKTEDAEKAKIDGAFIVTHTHVDTGAQITGEQKQFSHVIESSLMPMIRDLKQVLIAYKSQHHHNVRAVLITGGTSLIPNLPLFIEEQLKIPVYPYSYISSIVGQTLQLSETTETRIPTAVGLALSQIKPDRNSNINLRKGDLAKSGGSSAFNFSVYKKMLATASLVLAFIFVNLIIQYMVLSSRSSNQEARLERTVKSVLGAVSPSTLRTYISSPSTLKAAVEKELAKYQDAKTVSVKTTLSGLDLLNKLSTTMPRDMTLDSNLFEFKGGKFKLTGIVDQVQQVERIGKALNDTNFLTDLAKGKTEEDPKKKTVKFEFTAKLAEAPAQNVKTK